MLWVRDYASSPGSLASSASPCPDVSSDPSPSNESPASAAKGDSFLASSARLAAQPQSPSLRLAPQVGHRP